MAIKKISVTQVYEKTVDAFNQGYKIVLHEGGSRSSKTWSIFQFFLGKAIAGENITLTIVRDKLTWIKSTLLKDFEEITNMMELTVSPEININRPEQTYYVNGSEFAFYGLDYAEKLHGRSQDWFWMNETMECAKKHFDQLEMRTRIGGILDYNPYDDMHWVFDLPKRDDVFVIKSSMLDNPFLSESIRVKIRSYEPTAENIKQGTADEFMWQVYGLGNKARLQGTIFNNWDIVDGIPQDAKLLGMGLDFGYTNDPTALVEVYKYDNELYLNELIYDRGLLNSDIAQRMQEMNVNGYTDIYADSSEPKSIEEIRRYGFNIRPVDKGGDSIDYGIGVMKSYKMHITKRSSNLELELRRYKWAEDRGGKILNKPVDAFNHGIDACRYAVMMLLGKQPEIQIFNRERFGL